MLHKRNYKHNLWTVCTIFSTLGFLFNSRTIFYLSLVYTIGSVVIALGAIPTLHLPASGATVIGLLLIAIGTGGIKPCVSAFGGDQFKLPEQAKFLATFFSLFYLSINAGSLLSTTITPLLRENHCFGELSCYSLAFGVPGILMVVSIGRVADHKFVTPQMYEANFRFFVCFRFQ